VFATIDNVLEVVRIDDEPVSVRIGGHEFACEEETGCVTVPKGFLRGFLLSEIPEDISIKPVEKIEGNRIHVKNEVTLYQFEDGSATAAVEEMFRRKFWDGETGLSPYITALRQAVAEKEATEKDFQDDGDYIFLHYDITISEDLGIQEAILFVDAAIEGIQKRADQLVSRRRDRLLDIFDRGSFEDDLRYALDGNEPVALILADIDHFKRMNDTFGHLVGDEVLCAVAKVFSSNCDGRNRVEYRYGGEELAVILTGGDGGEAAELAESIRAEVERLRLKAHPELKVTISMGVSDGACAGRDSAELVKDADAALYSAKNEGRNRVRARR
jgi:diguanylate cyclase (GGDEF)-like protein